MGPIFPGTQRKMHEKRAQMPQAWVRGSDGRVPPGCTWNLVRGEHLALQMPLFPLYQTHSSPTPSTEPKAARGTSSKLSVTLSKAPYSLLLKVKVTMVPTCPA